MKKSTTLGLIATVALTFSPLAAFANGLNHQDSFQGAAQTSATVGTGNTNVQFGNLDSYQDQANFHTGKSPTVNLQSSQQHLQQEAAVIGDKNHSLQFGDLNNHQSQFDANPPVPGYYYIHQPGY